MAPIVKGLMELCRGMVKANPSIGHDRAFTLMGDAKPNLREHPHRSSVADPRKLGHGSDHDEIFFHLRHARFLCLNLEPLADGDFDVLDRFFPRVALGMATGQRWATHRPSFFRLNQANSILHGDFMAQLDCGCNASSRRLPAAKPSPGKPKSPKNPSSSLFEMTSFQPDSGAGLEAIQRFVSCQSV
jgi:hypothetical protein